MIARDDAPASATTLLAQADQPDRLLGPAATCYLDAIGFAAEHHLPQHVKDAIDTAGNSPRAHRRRRVAHPAQQPDAARSQRPQPRPTSSTRPSRSAGSTTPATRAAVITYRLDLTQASAGRTRGPLPWLPGIPTQLLDDPYWKTYLSDRYQLTRQLGEETHQHAHRQPRRRPAGPNTSPGSTPTLVADIQLWRAANQIPDTDLRPTGPPALRARRTRHPTPPRPPARDRQAGIREWAPRITEAAPAVGRRPPPARPRRTPRHPQPQAGQTSPNSSRQAAAQGHLPDDHPADALGYRITTLTKTDSTPRRTLGNRHPRPTSPGTDTTSRPPCTHPDTRPGIGI